MPTTYQAVRSMLDSRGARYLIEPQSGALMLGNTSPPDHYYMVALILTEDGAWLQLQTVSFLSCPTEHPHFVPVLRLMAELNYHYRGIKYALDFSDGEITAYADLLIGDSQPTVDQIFGLIAFYMRLLNEGCPRLMATIKEGKDPGLPAVPAQPEELV